MIDSVVKRCFIISSERIPEYDTEHDGFEIMEYTPESLQVAGN